MNKYAVMGFPITHSKSPQIHRLFAEQTGEALTYDKLEVPADSFIDALHAFFQQNGSGLNITVPLKNLAYQHVDELDAYAETAQAVNTIRVDSDHKLQGYNTDGIGLLRDLMQNHQIELNQRSILVLGAGGAVQGVLKNLLEQNPSLLTIANRTVEKAEQLAQRFTTQGNINACGFEQIKAQYDLIINGTSASLNNALPPIPSTCLKPNAIVYDMMYSDKATAFVQWGMQNGARLSIDGLGMLVEQAAEAFYIWRKKQPDTRAVLRQLRPTI